MLNREQKPASFVGLRLAESVIARWMPMKKYRSVEIFSLPRNSAATNIRYAFVNAPWPLARPLSGRPTFHRERLWKRVL